MTLKKLKKFLKKLEKQGIITKKPHPIYPFLLFIISLIILLIAYQTNDYKNDLLLKFLLILTIINFIFSVTHLIVVSFLEN